MNSAIKPKAPILKWILENGPKNSIKIQRIVNEIFIAAVLDEAHGKNLGLN